MLRHSALSLAALLLMAAPQTLTAQSAELPMPTSFTARFVVLYSRVGPPPTTPEAMRLMQRHVQYQLRLHADGVAMAGGPFGEGADTTLVGMTVLKVATLADAERIAQADPAVREGAFRVRLVQWLTPEGQLR